MRENSATVGETDGSIIAAIITTHTARNQPSAPRSVPGPSSIPRIRSTVDHHASAARPKSRATSPIRARAAASAGPRPDAEAVTWSGRPGELRGREPALPFVLDPERVDPRARRLGDVELGAHRVEDPRDPRRLLGFLAERHDVLDLEVDRVADPDAVPEPVVDDLDRSPLDPQVLADEPAERRHRAAELPAEDAEELLGLLVRCLLIDEHAE